MMMLWSQHVPALLSAVFSCALCALLGNFLLWRRQSLLADALSHVVLLGIVIAFFLTQSQALVAMTGGALVAALAAAILIAIISHVCRLDSGAVIGVVFTTFFALGVLLLEVWEFGQIHLDIEHALYGHLEGIIWPSLAYDRWSLATWSHIPREIIHLMLAFIVSLGGVIILYRRLLVDSFDPGFGQSIGFNSFMIALVFIVGVALAAVTSFAAIGSLLVIAMFIAPPAMARLCCHRLSDQIVFSLVMAIILAISGYSLAQVPAWMTGHSLNAAAMIAVVAASAHAVLAWSRRHH